MHAFDNFTVEEKVERVGEANPAVSTDTSHTVDEFTTDTGRGTSNARNLCLEKSKRSSIYL